MDSLGIAIIVISVVLAVLFKLVVVKRIQNWMDQDLIRSLANDDSDIKERLTSLEKSLREEGLSRNERHIRIEAEANLLKQTKSS